MTRSRMLLWQRWLTSTGGDTGVMVSHLLCAISHTIICQYAIHTLNRHGKLLRLFCLGCRFGRSQKRNSSFSVALICCVRTWWRGPRAPGKTPYIIAIACAHRGIVFGIFTPLPRALPLSHSVNHQDKETAHLPGRMRFFFFFSAPSTFVWGAC